MVGALFFAPRTAQEGPRNGGSGAGHIQGPGAGKALYIKAYKAGGPLHPPRKSAAAADARERALRPMVRL